MVEKEKSWTIARAGAAAMIALSHGYLPFEKSERESAAMETESVHVLFEQALEGEMKIIGPYGTPVTPGWGSIANGVEEQNDDVEENFEEVNRYLEGLLAGYEGEVRVHADLVFAYGLNEAGGINIVGKSVEFAKAMYERGYTASLNIRPPATFTTEELGELVRGIYSGELTYQDGGAIVEREFIKKTGIPLSLDLEEMANRGYPGGVPGEELAKILIEYRDIMRSYGHEEPTVIIYDMAFGEGDHYMTDDVAPLKNIEGLNIVVTFAGFFPGVDQERNLERKEENTENLQETYDQKRGGCMLFVSKFLPKGGKDNIDEELAREYVNSDICAYISLQ